MSKKMSRFAAALALVFALSAAARAVPIPVANHSFETPDLRALIPNDQPTRFDDPTGWTKVRETGGRDAIALDGRWQPQWSGLTVGPTDGVQALLFDNRNPTTDAELLQDLGSITSLGIGGASKLVMQFDARFGQFNTAPNSGNAQEDPNVDFYAFFTVNGERDTAHQFHSNMGAGDRLIPAWTELSPAPPATDRFSTDPNHIQAFGHRDNMGHFTVELSLSGVGALDMIGIGLQYTATNQIGCCDSRTYVDNIRVDATELAILSDLTNNGFVDFEDLTILLANWNQNVTAAEGNLVNADTTPVNFEDLTVLLADWTGPGPAGSPEAALGDAAIPEPSTLLLALLATLGLSFYRRRRRAF